MHSTQTYSADDASKGLQDFAICVEMFFAAWMHWYIYPASEFGELSEQQAQLRDAQNGSIDGLASDHTLLVRAASMKLSDADAVAARSSAYHPPDFSQLNAPHRPSLVEVATSPLMPTPAQRVALEKQPLLIPTASL